MKKAKFDVLMQGYIELSNQLKSVEHKLIKDLLESWEKLFQQIEEFLTLKEIRKLQMTSGLRQGLKDLPEIFSATFPIWNGKKHLEYIIQLHLNMKSTN